MPLGRRPGGGFLIPKAPLDKFIGQLIFDYENQHKKYRCHYDVMAITLALATGLRSTDLVRLTWRQVLDPEGKGYIEIDENKKRRFINNMGYTKQTLPVTDFARKVALRVYRNMTKADQARAYIFGAMRHDFYRNNSIEKRFKGIVMQSATLRLRVKRVVKEYNFLGGSPSYDCFRVTWARRMYDGFIAADVDPNFALMRMQVIMNHATPEQTRRYLRLDFFTQEDQDMMNMAFPVSDVEENMPEEPFKEAPINQVDDVDTTVDNEVIRDLGSWRGVMSFG